VLTGQYLEHKLNVSDVSSSWGTSAYEGLKKAGVGDTTSFVVGGVVTVASTPAALAVAAYKKAVSLW
jgi:tripartite-type tricarboxylate transporter receptor subunit TctC